MPGSGTSTDPASDPVSDQPTEKVPAEQASTVIVGSGFSGLGMAIALLDDGRDDFVILEKAHELGGTWRDNSYPGCACDIQSHMYSFSYELNPEWSRTFAAQSEILDYLKRVAEKYDLYRHIRFGQEMTGAHWDEDRHLWHVDTVAGARFTGQFLVSGIGSLHIPQVPALEGIERFRGASFHSANWNHEYDLRNKRVAVIGTGASAIQFVPQIAPEVAELTVFQRTPPWIMPKPDRPIPEAARSVFRRVPALQRAYRNAVYWILESRAVGFNGHPGVLQLAEKVAGWHMRRTITDPELRRALTPDYRMGCKRVLVSNDYYPALRRDNVAVTTSGVREVREHSIVDAGGVEREVDAIIYGTGFHVTDAFDYLRITGRDGRDLADEWRSAGMRTNKGVTVEGFPNLFFLLGPNTGLGHNSVVFMIESQVRYVLEAMRYVQRAGGDALAVRTAAQDRFQEHIQRKLHKGIWTQGGCTSWYLDAKGVNRTIWPGFTWKYWWQTRTIDPSEYELLGRGESRGRAGYRSGSATRDEVATEKSRR